jgi:hypothetical protein
MAVGTDSTGHSREEEVESERRYSLATKTGKSTIMPVFGMTKLSVYCRNVGVLNESGRVRKQV